MSRHRRILGTPTKIHTFAHFVKPLTRDEKRQQALQAERRIRAMQLMPWLARKAVMAMLLLSLGLVGCGGPAEAQLPGEDYVLTPPTVEVGTAVDPVTPVAEFTGVIAPVPSTPTELADELVPTLDQLELDFMEGVDEAMAEMPASQRVFLPADFRERFIAELHTGLPALREKIVELAVLTYTEDELEAQLEFKRQHPGLDAKQGTFAKGVLKLSMDFGRKAGEAVAR